MRRRLIGAFAILCGLALWGQGPPGIAWAADGADPCAPFVVPPELGLRCRVEHGMQGEVLVIEPEGGTFQALSRLTFRELDPKVDRLAWSEPETWLERQMILDVDGLSTALDEVGSDPDSPFGSDMIKSGIRMLVDGLNELSRLPLSACDEPASRSEIDCRFGVEPFVLYMRVLLAARDERRFAINIRTFNEQRLRHFSAIANSLEADAITP